MPWGAIGTFLEKFGPAALMYMGTRGLRSGAEGAAEASAGLSDTMARILASQWEMQGPFQQGLFHQLADRSRQQIPQILPGAGPPPAFDPRAGIHKPRAPMLHEATTHQPANLPPSTMPGAPMAHNRFPDIARALMEQVGSLTRQPIERPAAPAPPPTAEAPTAPAGEEIQWLLELLEELRRHTGGWAGDSDAPAPVPGDGDVREAVPTGPANMPDMYDPYGLVEDVLRDAGMLGPANMPDMYDPYGLIDRIMQRAEQGPANMPDMYDPFGTVERVIREATQTGPANMPDMYDPFGNVEQVLRDAGMLEPANMPDMYDPYGLIERIMRESREQGAFGAANMPDRVLNVPGAIDVRPERDLSRAHMGRDVGPANMPDRDPYQIIDEALHSPDGSSGIYDPYGLLDKIKQQIQAAVPTGPANMPGYTLPVPTASAVPNVPGAVDVRPSRTRR